MGQRKPLARWERQVLDEWFIDGSHTHINFGIPGLMSPTSQASYEHRRDTGRQGAPPLVQHHIAQSQSIYRAQVLVRLARKPAN